MISLSQKKISKFQILNSEYRIFFLCACSLILIGQVFSWNDAERLSNTPGTSTTAISSGSNCVAVDQIGRIHVVWHDYSNNPQGYPTPNVWYKRFDPGIGWTNDTCINDVNENAWQIKCAVDDSNNLHIVWYRTTTNNQIRYKMWRPTTGWSASEIISNLSSIYRKYYPAVATTPNSNIHIVWQESIPPYNQIMYREKIAGVWQPQVQLTNSASNKSWPAIAGDGSNNLHIAWQGREPSDTNDHIYYRARISGTWQNQELVSTGFRRLQASPSLYARNDTVHCVWSGYHPTLTYFYRIYYKPRTTAGWGVLDTLVGGSQTTNYARFNPHIIGDTIGNIRVVWYGQNPGFSNYELWHRRRTGAGWQPTGMIPVGYPGGSKYNANLAISPGEPGLPINVVWSDIRYGNYEVFRVFQYPNDMKVMRIVSPPTFTGIGTYTPQVWIKNAGENPQPSFTVYFSIEPGGYSSTRTVLASNPNDSFLITFAAWTPGTGGLYNGKCSLGILDQFSENNLMTRLIAIAEWIESFENGPVFIPDPDSGWEWGTPSGGVGPTTAYSGTKCWGTNIDGNYSSNANWKLDSPWYEAEEDTPMLGFYHWDRIEYQYDGGNVKLSKDGLFFDTLHSLIPPGYDTRALAQNAGIPNESCYSSPGTVARSWRGLAMRIPVMLDDTFLLRWHFGSDAFVTYPGWYIDYFGGIGFQRFYNDAATEQILEPLEFDSGETFYPKAVVRNYSTRLATFNGRFKIYNGGLVYENLQEVTLLPGASDTVLFDPTSLLPGIYLASCSTEIVRDTNKNNDKIYGVIIVLGSPTLFSPPHRILTNDNTPSFDWSDLLGALEYHIQVDNDSLFNSPEIDTIITSSELPEAGPLTDGVYFWRVKGHSANNMGPWSAIWKFTIDATPPLNPTLYSPANNSIIDTLNPTFFWGSVVVGQVPTEHKTIVHKCTCAPVLLCSTVKGLPYRKPLAEQAAVPSGRDLVRQLLVAGVSYRLQVDDEPTFATPMNIDIITNETTYAVTSPLSEDTFYWRVMATDEAGNQGQWSNVWKFEIVLETLPAPTPAWVRKTDVSFGRKPVKGGGALVAIPEGKIYALKGNNTNDFGFWTIGDEVWTQAESIPYSDKKKRVKPGAGLIFYDGGSTRQYIYATKGANTYEFWRYGLSGSVIPGWYQLPDVPSGSKALKGGTVLAIVDANKDGKKEVFLLKGSKTKEAYLFDITSGAWGDALPNVPISFTKATSGVGVNDSLVYILTYDKVSKTNAFYQLNLKSNIWISKRSLPLVGSTQKKKKVKEGTAMTYDPARDKIYAFKGGNIKEFYEYKVAVDSWYSRDDIPLTTKKGVKAGATLTYSLIDNNVYAFPGNNLNEFWRYTPLANSEFVLLNSEFNSSNQHPHAALRIYPNPIKDRIVVHYNLPVATAVSLKLYNPLGNLVKSEKIALTTKSGLLGIESKRLPSGVYLLKVETANLQITRKIVIRRW